MLNKYLRFLLNFLKPRGSAAIAKMFGSEIPPEMTNKCIFLSNSQQEEFISVCRIRKVCNLSSQEKFILLKLEGS